MYETALVSKDDGSPVIGLALGSGGARGWAHIGVITTLAGMGIRPDVVAGASIGALVGAALVSDRIEPLEDWVKSLTWQDVVAMLDISLKGGLIRGDRVVQYCSQQFFLPTFAEVPTPFACIATELSSGREIWLRDGSIADAVRASIALPGLFSPSVRNGRVLVDGGLVNPVPVSLCRALGAEVVIAVELGSGVTGRTTLPRERSAAAQGADTWAQRLLTTIGWHSDELEPEVAVLGTPSLADVVTSSINIMQSRLARSRLAGEPADVLISPRVAHLSMLAFDRAADAILEGAAAVERAHPMLHQALGLEGS